MAEKSTELASREAQQRMARRESWPMAGSPFGLLQRFMEDMDRAFEDFGLRPRWRSPRSSGDVSSSWRGASVEQWAPDIEMFQRNHELVVRADLPGLKKDDVKVDVTDDTITIQGERQQEEETEHEGVYRSERRYGSFYRAIPLPEGAITDQAKANFTNGVLEITIPAPPEPVTRGRRLEIKDAKK
jgi:HSP20 family protein